MTISIIDCGTNTFHLLIAETIDQSFKVVYKKNIAVKLGQGGMDDGMIAPAAFARGLNALKEFNESNKEYKTEKVLAFATAAVRKASNGDDFINAVLQQTGIEVKRIDGNTEAELIYYGVRQAVQLGDKKNLVMDIGGGSVEFIIADANTIFWKQSFELGAALLLEKFKPSDPIADKEIEEFDHYISLQLHPLIKAMKLFPGINTLVGSSGSFETFAEMISEQFYSLQFDYSDKTEFELSLAHYESIHQLLLDSTSVQRKAMKGIIDMRVDMIVIASIILHYVIHNTTIEKLKLSTYALKEGMLYFAMKQ